MNNKRVIVYDPTTTDKASKVRGVGRYVQILRENFPSWTFTNELRTINYELPTVLINPFINFLRPPSITKRLARKQVAVIHDLITLKYPTHFPAGLRGRWRIAQNKAALKHYDAFVTDSEASRQDIVNILKIPSEKIHVIYPTLPAAFDKNEKKSTHYKLPTTNYFIYVGDVTWNKNLIILARALKMADATCVFVGKAFKNSSRFTVDGSQTNPWLEEYIEFMKEAEGNKRFIFPGFVSDEHLTHLYRSARANILISRDEGFGFSYLEAASFGTPSILSDIPVFREIARDTATFVDPNDIEAIVKTLKSSPSSSKKLQEHAQSFSSAEFKKNWENVAT